ncbi:MAG: hypothetical protein JWO50_861 [Candidatus Kaiserbacteria bacterium]|nr:hypothetical protein [Candidatus Kaiserbacteria bacterium]
MTRKIGFLWYNYQHMILEQIRNQIKDAMRARDQLLLDTLRGIISACTNELVSKGRKPTDTLTDSEIITVLKRLAKQRTDAAEQFTKGGRPEMAEKELKEKTIIEQYLPEQTSREDIEKVAKAKKAELGITDSTGAGKLMGAVIKEFEGNADGAVVKEVVASLFG